MRHVVTWNGEKLQVSLPDTVPDGMSFPVAVSGRSYQARWLRSWGLLILEDESGVEHHCRVRGSRITRFDGDADTEVRAEMSEGPHIHTLTATVGFDMPGHGARAKGSREQVVRSQITGKVLKVLVKAGDAVAAGQPLLTIEAMKMENRVFAAQAGKVQTVSVKDGDPVQTGKELLRIAP